MLVAFPKIPIETLTAISSGLAALSVLLRLGGWYHGKRLENKLAHIQANDEVRDVFARAHVLARNLGHTQTSPDHLLSAIMSLPFSPVALRLEQQHGILPPNSQRLMAKAASRSVLTDQEELPLFDRRAANAFQKAMFEAADSGARELNPGHLVMGLILAGKSNAARRLTDGGVSPDSWRESMRSLPSQHG